ncbi:hypothetical protein CTAYLR_000491 [Chrysophaeum taylorii]|uniref:MYND-type domain-containing protein n=1 Tax=Chrysophaeum taylorii TaxID=2483200 RepID=A0AAD7UFZ0_9STRA|nr:hypothetical protein CTAYLR_000491 [Chrysophaeum taylorii]
MEACANCGRSATNRCANCREQVYCSRECQAVDWQRRHKTQCATEAAIRRAVATAASRGRRARDGVTCYVCLEGDGAEARLIHAGCGCRGSAGWVHVSCLLETLDHTELRPSLFKLACPSCKLSPSGVVKVRQLQKLWRLCANRSGSIGVVARGALALVLEQHLEFDEALRQCRAAIDLANKLGIDSDLELRVCESRILAKCDRHAEAADLLEPFLVAPGGSLPKLQAASALALALCKAGKPIDAERVATDALRKAPADKHRATRRTLTSHLATALASQGKFDRAFDLLVPCATELMRELGRHHEHTRHVITHLDAIIACWRRTACPDDWDRLRQADHLVADLRHRE